MYTSYTDLKKRTDNQILFTWRDKIRSRATTRGARLNLQGPNTNEGRDINRHENALRLSKNIREHSRKTFYVLGYVQQGYLQLGSGWSSFDKVQVGYLRLGYLQ